MSRILGLGLDLVEQERVRRAVNRHGERFVQRIAGEEEVASRAGSLRTESLAGLFAAKEAVLKALGTGWAEGVGFRQVVVLRLPSGAPTVRFEGEAARRAERLGVSRVHLSITHDGGVAAAVAVLEGTPRGDRSTDGD
jgi:holo-[acyl-carrier protein] synthase